MKRQSIMRSNQLEKFAVFIMEHPGFWPELVGQDALVCGFHVGSCFLTVDEMEKLIAAEPVLEAQPAMRSHSVVSDGAQRSE